MTRPKVVIPPGPYVRYAPGALLVTRESRRRLPAGVSALGLFRVERPSPTKPWLMCRVYPLCSKHYSRKRTKHDTARYYTEVGEGLELVHPAHVLRYATPQETALFRESHP